MPSKRSHFAIAKYMDTFVVFGGEKDFETSDNTTLVGKLFEISKLCSRKKLDIFGDNRSSKGTI